MKKPLSLLLTIGTLGITLFTIFAKLQNVLSQELLLHLLLVVAIILVGFGMIAHRLASSEFEQVMKDSIKEQQKKHTAQSQK